MLFDFLKCRKDSESKNPKNVKKTQKNNGYIKLCGL